MPVGEFIVLDSVLMGYFVFGLVLVRMSAMVMTAQFFGSQQAPLRARAGMSAFFAICVLPTAIASWKLGDSPTLNAADILLLTFEEFSIGIVIGILSNIIYSAASMAGQIAGQQIGFAMANLIDPLSNLNVSLVGFLQSQAASLIFLILNLHLYLIYLVSYSYEMVGIGQWSFYPFLAAAFDGITAQVDGMLTASIQVAMPVVVIMLMASVIIGFVTRTMPQMNIMVFGMPLRVVLGLLSILFLIPGMMSAFAGSPDEVHTFFDSENDGLWRQMLDIIWKTLGVMGKNSGS